MNGTDSSVRNASSYSIVTNKICTVKCRYTQYLRRINALSLLRCHFTTTVLTIPVIISLLLQCRHKDKQPALAYMLWHNETMTRIAL